MLQVILLRDAGELTTFCCVFRRPHAHAIVKEMRQGVTGVLPMGAHGPIFVYFDL
jgi:hypothetical protein